MLRLKILARLAVVSSLTALVGMSANAQDRISDFSLVDADGQPAVSLKHPAKRMKV